MPEKDEGDQIAEALAAYANDPLRNYRFSFEAEAMEDPTAALSLGETPENLRGTFVAFVPTDEERARIDGCAVNVRHTITAFVSRYLQDGVTRKDLQGLAKEIYVSLENVEMAGYDWESTAIVAKYDTEQLTGNRFLSVFTITYYGIE